MCLRTRRRGRSSVLTQVGRSLNLTAVRRTSYHWMWFNIKELCGHCASTELSAPSSLLRLNPGAQQLLGTCVFCCHQKIALMLAHCVYYGCCDRAAATSRSACEIGRISKAKLSKADQGLAKLSKVRNEAKRSQATLS